MVEGKSEYTSVYEQRHQLQHEVNALRAERDELLLKLGAAEKRIAEQTQTISILNEAVERWRQRAIDN